MQKGACLCPRFIGAETVAMSRWQIEERVIGEWRPSFGAKKPELKPVICARVRSGRYRRPYISAGQDARMGFPFFQRERCRGPNGPGIDFPDCGRGLARAASDFNSADGRWSRTDWPVLKIPMRARWNAGPAVHSLLCKGGEGERVAFFGRCGWMPARWRMHWGGGLSGCSGQLVIKRRKCFFSCCRVNRRRCNFSLGL